MTTNREPRYQPKVLMGNWYEENCLAREKIKTFISQRDTKELLVEKTRQLFDNFHKEVELDAPKRDFNFGSFVQIMPFFMNVCDQDMRRDIHPALSVVINERVVRHSQYISEECEITVAPSMQSCVRNTFRIVSADERDRSDELLKYGQHFCLQCADSNIDPMLLYSAPKCANLMPMIRTTFDTIKRGEINLAAGLIKYRRCGPGKDVPRGYTHWICNHINPSRRFEFEGRPIPSNTPLIIKHVATNKNLAVGHGVIQTLFGPEYLVSVQNYQDCFNRPSWPNVWMFSNGHNIVTSY